MVVLTGEARGYRPRAVSAHSGAPAVSARIFKIEDVSTLEAFPQNPVRIDNFYRLRRRWHK